jgi:hypothetical protein
VGFRCNQIKSAFERITQVRTTLHSLCSHQELCQSPSLIHRIYLSKNNRSMTKGCSTSSKRSKFASAKSSMSLGLLRSFHHTVSIPHLHRSHTHRAHPKKEGLANTRTKTQKHTTGGIPRWSPTLVLVARFSAYVWQSGRDAQFSLTYGRMCLLST